MTVRTIRADYDDEAKVFFIFDSDVPGLLADGAMLEELQGKIAQRFTEMLKGNAHLILDKEKLVGPHEVRLVTYSETRQLFAA